MGKIQKVCKTSNCNNLGFMRGTRNGIKRYSPWCKLCASKKWNLNPRNLMSPRDRLRYDFKGFSCSLCGWNKASCDLHRIIPGHEGGKYTKENISILCPNCHREVHKKMENKTNYLIT